MSDNAKIWFAEIGLDPSATSVAMGTRSLGDRPWLISDAHRDAELALKAELCRDRHAEVFAAFDGTDEPANDVLVLLESAGVDLVDVDVHPLEVAGRSVQEDLCLMHRQEAGWHLEAASLCFPSRWRLADKFGRHITEVHGPVEGYRERLASRVDRLFDRLTESPVWRRNWFVHPDDALFQPDRPAEEQVIAAAEVGEGLYLRSERQTLRRITPGWILFTIRVQQAPLGRFLADDGRRAAFANWIAETPGTEAARRGISEPQRQQLRLALRPARSAREQTTPPVV